MEPLNPKPRLRACTLRSTSARWIWGPVGLRLKAEGQIGGFGVREHRGQGVGVKGLRFRLECSELHLF